MRRSGLRVSPYPVVENARLQPGVGEAGDGADGVEFGFQGGVRDAVEAFGDVGVEDEFGFEADEVEDGFNGVVGGASGAKAVGVGFKPGADCPQSDPTLALKPT